MTARVLLAVIVCVAWLPCVARSVESTGIDSRLDAAVAVYRQDGAQQALPQFEQLGRDFSRGTNTRATAAAVHYIGECYWRLGQFEKAHQSLDRALALERQANDRTGEARTRNVLGLLAWDEGNYEQAVAQFKAARALAHQLADRKLEGASLNNLSLVYDELGDYDTSLKQYAEVLELYRGADFPRGVGDTLGNIGGVHLLLGQFREALESYQQALVISEQLKSTTSLSQDHGNVALCLMGLGDLEAALQHFDQAIALSKQAGMRQDEAYWLRQKGNGLIHRGQYDRGLKAHRAALAVYEQLGAKAELAEALHDSGRLYLLLGDTGTAERYFNRSLALARRIGLARGVTQNLIALGDLQFRRKAFAVAATLYQQARARASESGAKQQQAQALLRLAQVHREQSQWTPAATEAAQALAIARGLAAPTLVSDALLTRAELERRRGQLPQALQSFAAAQETLTPASDPDLLWQVHYGRGRTQEARGELRAAVESLVEAVTLIESLRNRLQEPRFRSGFIDDKYDVYVDLVRLQLQLGRTADAFSTAERLRARSFAEQLTGRTPQLLSDDDRRTEAQLIERIRHLQRAVVVGDESGAGDSTRPERAINRLSVELQRAEREFQSFLDDRATGSRAVPSPDSRASAAGIQQLLRDDEALLEYVVGVDCLMAFVITRRDVTATVTQLRTGDLEARIALLRDLVQRPGDDRWRKPAARLATDLLALPRASGQLAGVGHLYVVPHGALHYLPFSLLPLDSAPAGDLLIDRYAVAYLPAAATLLQTVNAQIGPRSLLAMAPARSRLRYAPDEARSIDAMYQPNSRLLLGNGATESQFKRLAGGFGTLHLATHGAFNKLNPLLSGIELEADGDNDGLLQVHEVLGLRLHADLVTLSACETALGSGYFAEMPAGDDFVGMTRAFLAAGSGAVVAALWDVDDRASFALMKRFYGHLRQSGLTPNAVGSLAEAQQDLRAIKDLAHPYYWAPFVVIGNMNQATGRANLAAGR